MASKKRVRSGYHSSTGPSDFMKKKYTSNLLSVCIQIYILFRDLTFIYFRLQRATDKLFKDSKDDLYRKILDTYEEKKKSGLSSDLLGKLKRRRRLRRMRHHRRTKKHRKIYRL